MASLCLVTFGVPTVAADPDASCSTANTMPTPGFVIDSVHDVPSSTSSELEVDFWTDPSPGIHVWILQTLASQVQGNDYARLTVYSGECSNNTIVCEGNTNVVAAVTPGTNGVNAYSAMVCVAVGPSWARVWYRDGGDTGSSIDYILIHASTGDLTVAPTAGPVVSGDATLLHSWGSDDLLQDPVARACGLCPT